jgi:hypothetical protein
MRRILMFALLTVAFALGTILVGWTAVPVLAALLSIGMRRVEAPRYAAIGAACAWALLLLRVTAFPAASRLLQVLNELFRVPGLLIAALAVVFAGALAWSAARLVAGLVPMRG